MPTINSKRSLRQSWFPATIFVAALAAACLAVGGTAHAQVTRTWSINNNSVWSNTANWAGGLAAGSLGTTNNTDTALLSAVLTAGNVNIAVGTNRNLQNINIDGGNTSSNAWQIGVQGGNFWLTSGGTIQLTGSGAARTDRMEAPLLLLGNNASYTFANNSTLSTRLLQIVSPITGQSTTGNTTTIYLAGSNSGTSRFEPSAMSGGTNGGGLAIVKQGAGTWSWAGSSGTSFVAGSFIPVTINEGRLTGSQLVAAPRSLTLANVAGAEYMAPSGLQFGGLASLSGGGPLGGNININGQLNYYGMYVGFDNTSTTFGGRAIDTVTNANSGLNKVGTGTLTLTGSDNNFGLTSRVQVRQGALRLDFSQSTTGTDILAATQGIGFAGGNLLLTGSSGGTNSQSFASTTVSAGSRLVLASNGANGLVVSGSAITRSVGGTLDITLPDGSQSATNGVRTTTVTAANGVLTSAASNGIAYATVGGTTWAGLSGASGTVNILPLSSYATGNANYTSANNIDVTDADAPSAFTVNTLRFNGNNTLNLTGANTVATGGVLVTSAAGTGATISSGTLRSGGGTELVFHNYGSQLTIGSTIANSVSGASDLTLSGTGRYLLNGNMTHTGLTRIMSGSVQLGSSSALGTNPQVDIAADPNATLDLNGFDLTIGALSGAGGVVGQYGQVGNASNASSSLFNMTGGLVNMGAKSLSVGSLNTSTVYNGRIAGSGTFSKVGTSQLTMYSANAFSGFNGTIVVESGTLQAGVFADGVYGYDSFGAASSIVLGKAGSANATLGVGSGSSARPITLATGNSGTLTIAATITGSPVYSGAINGTGNLVFSNAADFFYISGTINNVGTVTFTTVSPNVDSKRYAVSGEIGSNVTDLTLRVTSPSSGANVSTFSGPMKNTGALLIEGQAGALGNVTLSGTISSISSLTLTSLSGTTPRATFSAANTFTAPVSIQSGTLIASNAQALGINSAVTIANSANAALNVNGVNLAIGSLSGVGPGGNLSFANASSRLTTGSTNLNTTYSGSASGAGGFTKVGTGTFTLGGTTTNTGTNFVNQGTLRLASAGAISTAPMNVAESGVLDLAVNVATTGTVTMSGSAASILGLGTLTAPGYAFTNTSGTSTASVNLLGAGGLAKSGSGIALLSGANTYSGTTSVTAGILGISSTAALPSWTGGRLSVSAGGALVVGDGVSDADFENIRSNGTFAANSFIGFNTTGSGTYAGTIANTAGGANALGLMKIGSGTETLTAVNTYTGTTAINDGVLRLGRGDAIASSSMVALSGNGRLGFASTVTSATVAGLVTGTAPMALGNDSAQAVALTLGGGNASSTYAGNFTGAGSLVKLGAGTFTLTGNSSHAGTTTVGGGVLALGSVNALAGGGIANAATSGMLRADVAGGSYPTITTPGIGILTVSGSSSSFNGATLSAGLLEVVPTASSTIALSTLSRSAGSALSLQRGSGVITVSSTTALPNGIIGPWAVTGSTTSLRYVTQTGGTISPYTGGTAAATNANLSNSPSANVDLAAATGAVPSVVSANTIRYTGPGSQTLSNTSSSFTVNGLMNAGSSHFTINSGTITIGSANELVVVNNANTFSIGSVIRENAAGQGLTFLSQGGVLILNAAAGNQFTGPINVTGGNLQLNSSGTYGAINLSESRTLSASVSGLQRLGAIAGVGSTFAKAGSGTTVMSSTTSSYTGATDIQQGTVEISSLPNLGIAGGLGAPTTAANGTIAIGSSTNTAVLRYVGNSSSTTDRVVNLAGTTGGVTLEANGSGALVFSSAFTATGNGAKTFTLTGSSTANNSIVSVPNGASSTVTSVDKTGAGTWWLTGNSGYSGQLRVLDGTLVVGTTVFDSSAGPFGTAVAAGSLPIIGNSAATTGTASLLVAGGNDIERGFSVASGVGQVVVLGATGTGSSQIGTNVSEIRLNRSAITLQAAETAEAVFAGNWRDGSGNANPTVAYTIGALGNAGVVVLESEFSSSATNVSIVNGTARLQAGADNRINSATPVSIGSSLGAAILDINGQSQTLSNLTFAGNSGSITNGTLRLASSGSVAVAGTGHVISSLVALDAATSFNVNAASRLGINSAISGNFGLTKTGAGILELSGTSGYSGPTLVSGGSLLVNGRIENSAVTVQSGGLLGGSGELLGGLTVQAGGTFSPGNSPGLLTTSELVLAGATLMEIDGLSLRGGIGGYDAVNVTGALTYGGSMVIDFGSAITSAFADNTEFNLFDFGSYTGLFSSITTANDGSFYAGLTFTGTGNKWTATAPGSQTLEFTHSTGVLVIVPEPGAFALAGIGIAAAAYAARSRSPSRKRAG